MTYSNPNHMLVQRFIRSPDEARQLARELETWANAQEIVERAVGQGEKTWR